MFFKKNVYRLNVAYDSGTDKPVLIMLHGIAASAKTWDPLISKLEQQYRCITIDLLGFGDSPRPSDISYETDDHLKAIDNTINKLKLKQPFTLAGHSMGSILGLEYTAWRYNKVKHLVMVSSPIYLKNTQHGSELVDVANTTYLKAYQTLREQKEFTVAAATQITKLLPAKYYLDVNEDSWHAFSHSLKNNIENQQVLERIMQTHCSIDIIYGVFDQFLVESNIKVVGKQSNVTLHKVAIADHTIRGKLAERVVQVLLERGEK